MVESALVAQIAYSKVLVFMWRLFYEILYLQMKFSVKEKSPSIPFFQFAKQKINVSYLIWVHYIYIYIMKKNYWGWGGVGERIPRPRPRLDNKEFFLPTPSPFFRLNEDFSPRTRLVPAGPQLHGKNEHL